MLVKRFLFVEGLAMTSRNVGEEYPARYHADEGCGKEHYPRAGFREMFRVVSFVEQVIGYGDHNEVADKHIEESTGVNPGSKNGWNPYEREGSREETEILTEMKEKTDSFSIRSISIHPPVPIIHPPQKETHPLDGEPRDRDEGRRGGGEKDCDTQRLGNTV